MKISEKDYFDIIEKLYEIKSKQEKATKTVLEQAELIAKDWTDI